ncbi:hypothetical protein D3C86_2047380 [compost metagenome]
MHRQLTAGIEGDIPLARAQVAEVNPEPFLAGDQPNAVGVHPAQRPGIHRHFRRGPFASDRADTAIGCYPVSPRHHRQ